MPLLFCYSPYASNAILQYLGDKYDTTGKLYPKDAKARAIVNHRLCFNLAMYYRNISEYVVSAKVIDLRKKFRLIAGNIIS